ncbi:MAG: hypothetical protein AB2L12_03735 [Smithellaceae bacterium]
MKIEQNKWTEIKGWEKKLPGQPGDPAQLVMIFGSPASCKNVFISEEFKSVYLQLIFLVARQPEKSAERWCPNVVLNNKQ